MQLWHLLHLDQAHPAVRVMLEFGMMTEVRDHDPHATGRLDDEGALFHRERFSIDEDVHHVRHQCIPAAVNAGCICDGSVRNGHRCSRIWVSYSSRKYCSVLRIGAIAASPNAHTVRPAMFGHRRNIVSMSFGWPRPCSMRSRICNSQELPSRQGV